MRATPHGERPLSVEEFEKQTGRQARDRLVDLMSRDADPYWSSLGREFKQYRHPREYVKPTEWLIPLFVAVRVLRRIGGLKGGIGE